MLKHLGSGENGELTFLDTLSIINFLIGIENLDLNLTQEDKQQLQHDLQAKIDLLLNEVHAHLEQQDAKLDEILQLLKSQGGN